LKEAAIRVSIANPSSSSFSLHLQFGAAASIKRIYNSMWQNPSWEANTHLLSLLSFCHLVSISSKYTLNSVVERGQFGILLYWFQLVLMIWSSILLIFYFVCVCPLLPLIMYLEYFWILEQKITEHVSCQTPMY
jgi:hypothetical protein